MARRLLAHVQRAELEAERVHAADRVDEAPRRELAVALGLEGRVHGPERRGELRRVEEGLRRRRVDLGRAADAARQGIARRRGPLGLVERAVGPADRRAQAADEAVADGLVGLADGLVAREGLRERQHGVARARHREVEAERVELDDEQARALAALRGDDGPRHGGVDVRVAVAVAAHPRRQGHGRRVERQGAAVVRERRVQLPQERGHGLPERRLDDGEPPARLLLGRRLRAAELVAAPERRDDAAELRLELPDLVGPRRERVELAEQLGDAAVLREERAPVHLRRVRREHDLRLLREQRVDDGRRRDALVQEAGDDARAGVALLREERGAAEALGGEVAHALVLLRGVGQREEVRERARDVAQRRGLQRRDLRGHGREAVRGLVFTARVERVAPAPRLVPQALDDGDLRGVAVLHHLRPEELAELLDGPRVGGAAGVEALHLLEARRQRAQAPRRGRQGRAARGAPERGPQAEHGLRFTF